MCTSTRAFSKWVLKDLILKLVAVPVTSRHKVRASTTETSERYGADILVFFSPFPDSNVEFKTRINDEFNQGCKIT